jgi:predicted Rdx family selenoprotein
MWAPIFSAAELRSGSHGVFRVELDGELIFDKDDAGRFPKKGEVSQLLRPRLGDPPQWR